MWEAFCHLPPPLPQTPAEMLPFLPLPSNGSCLSRGCLEEPGSPGPPRGAGPRMDNTLGEPLTYSHPDTGREGTIPLGIQQPWAGEAGSC